MVTVKREVYTESALPEHTGAADFDLDHLATTPRPGITEPKVPWWNPPDKPTPGPQESYESEFQVSLPIWPSVPTCQLKPDDRTVPTTLDHYEIQLQLLEQKSKAREATARRTSEAGSSHEPNVWTGPLEWKWSHPPTFDAELKPPEQQDKGKAVMRDEQSPVSGAVWTPPPGWEESLAPDYQNALRHLREQGETQLPKRLERAFSRQQPGETIRGVPLEGMHPILPNQAAKEDYSLQLRLLEEQNKKRLMMARQEQDSVSSTRPYTEAHIAHQHQDYQMQLMLLEQQNKKRLMMARQEQDVMSNAHPQAPRLSPEISPSGREQSVNSGSSTRPYTGTHSAYRYQDYQIQLMLLEQQNKKRLMMARQEQNVMSNAHPQAPQLSPEPSSSGREQSVDSVWSTRFTPESTPGFQEGQHSRMNSLGHIQLKFEPEPPQNSPAPSQSNVPSCDCVSSGQILRDHDLQVTMLEQQDRALEKHQPWKAADLDSPNSPPNWSLQHYQEQLMGKEQQERKRRLQEQQLRSSTQQSNHITPDYYTQVALLHEQNKKDLEIKRENQDTPTIAPQPRVHGLQEYQMQMMLLEQQDKKRKMMAKGMKSQASSSAEPIAEQDVEDMRKDHQGPVCVAGGSRADILHNKPLVIRERPTADD